MEYCFVIFSKVIDIDLGSKIDKAQSSDCQQCRESQVGIALTIRLMTRNILPCPRSQPDPYASLPRPVW